MSGSNGQPGVSLMNCVALLDVDPALGAQMAADQFRDARGACMVSVVGLRRGNFATQSASVDWTANGFLVIRGLLTRRLALGDRRSSEVLGRGDVIYPACAAEEPSLVSTTSWRVEQTTLLAVLDERFHRCAAGWPRLVTALQQRSTLRSHTLLVRLAIAEHPQIARRVHLMLWHLADRWGRREEHGMFLPLNLSRVALADLVCSTRESVSRSLGELERRGRVCVRDDGYLLHFPPPVERESAARDCHHASAARA